MPQAYEHAYDVLLTAKIRELNIRHGKTPLRLDHKPVETNEDGTVKGVPTPTFDNPVKSGNEGRPETKPPSGAQTAGTDTHGNPTGEPTSMTGVG